MSDLSDLIIPSGVVLLGAYAIQKMFATGQDDFTPQGKTCLGPICWSTYTGNSQTLAPVQTLPNQGSNSLTQPQLDPAGNLGDYLRALTQGNDLQW